MGTLEFRAHQNALRLLHCWTMGVKTAFTRPWLRLGHLDPFGRCLESNDVPGSRPNAPGKPKNYPQLFTRSQMLRWKKETYEGQQPDSKNVDVLADVGKKWLLDMEKLWNRRVPDWILGFEAHYMCCESTSVNHAAYEFGKGLLWLWRDPCYCTQHAVDAMSSSNLPRRQYARCGTIINCHKPSNLAPCFLVHREWNISFLWTMLTLMSQWWSDGEREQAGFKLNHVESRFLSLSFPQ